MVMVALYFNVHHQVMLRGVSTLSGTLWVSCFCSWVRIGFSDSSSLTLFVLPQWFFKNKMSVQGHCVLEPVPWDELLEASWK